MDTIKSIISDNLSYTQVEILDRLEIVSLQKKQITRMLEAAYKEGEKANLGHGGFKEGYFEKFKGEL